MMTIKLTQGKVAFIDDCDFQEISAYKWHALTDGYNWYAARKRDGKQFRMHNQLMVPPVGCFVDHLDGNGLNNQRRNMRVCSHAQNMANTKKKKNNKSGFKGVCWKKKNKKWVSQIKSGRVIHLGLFTDKIEAAMAYDEAALRIHGPFALTNKKLGLIPEPAAVLE